MNRESLLFGGTVSDQKGTSHLHKPDPQAARQLPWLWFEFGLSPPKLLPTPVLGAEAPKRGLLGLSEGLMPFWRAPISSLLSRLLGSIWPGLCLSSPSAPHYCSCLHHEQKQPEPLPTSCSATSQPPEPCTKISFSLKLPILRHFLLYLQKID